MLYLWLYDLIGNSELILGSRGFSPNDTFFPVI